MKKKYFIYGTLLLIISIIFTFLVTKVDVANLGESNTPVGFSSINSILTFKYNELIYKISDYLGYIALVIPVVYASLGGYQLIKNKSLKKVDKELYKLALFYVIVLVLYVLFDKIALNYRPVLIEGVKEASYPSSHTLMSLCFTISAVSINKKLFKDKFKVLNVLLLILGLSIVLTRYFSGVHWFTDIFGSILISSTLLTCFKGFLEK